MAIKESPRIAASILSADFARLGEQVRAAEDAGADIIHFDVMDGHFVPNITVGPLVVRALRPVSKLPFHVHLMMEEPERYIDEFAEAGADLLTVHVETCPHLHRAIEQIRAADALPAVTLNPGTPLVTLEEILPQVSAVLVMTVNPGFGGQMLIHSMVDKIRRLRLLLTERDLACSVQVDGGINEKTIRKVVDAGADTLVMGSAIFAAEDGIHSSIRRLKAAVQRPKSQFG
ncbi:MAG: ribulose-phosphate 3-epimerase [Chloroflexota bacterium]|nr:ribulose-phosphate 3-epimerase [Chloroflexota bacterium]